MTRRTSTVRTLAALTGSAAMLLATPAPASAGGPIEASGFRCFAPTVLGYPSGNGGYTTGITTQSSSVVKKSGKSRVSCTFPGLVTQRSDATGGNLSTTDEAGFVCLTPSGYTRRTTATVVGEDVVLECRYDKRSAFTPTPDDIPLLTASSRSSTYLVAGIESSSPRNPASCAYNDLGCRAAHGLG